MSISLRERVDQLFIFWGWLLRKKLSRLSKKSFNINFFFLKPVLLKWHDVAYAKRALLNDVPMMIKCCYVETNVFCVFIRDWMMIKCMFVYM